MSKSPDQAQFAGRVDLLVRRAGSISELARRVGVANSVLRKWRDGASDPSRANLLALARAADVPVAWLATGEEVGGAGAVDPKALGDVLLIHELFRLATSGREPQTADAAIQGLDHVRSHGSKPYGSPDSTVRVLWMQAPVRAASLADWYNDASKEGREARMRLLAQRALDAIRADQQRRAELEAMRGTTGKAAARRRPPGEDT